jgi:hypothetical protein
MTPETVGEDRHLRDTSTHIDVVEVVESEVRWFQCASARASGFNQACSLNHSDISPFRINHLQSCFHGNTAIVISPPMCRDHLQAFPEYNRRRLVE